MTTLGCCAGLLYPGALERTLVRAVFACGVRAAATAVPALRWRRVALPGRVLLLRVRLAAASCAEQSTCSLCGGEGAATNVWLSQLPPRLRLLLQWGGHGGASG